MPQHAGREPMRVGAGHAHQRPHGAGEATRPAVGRTTLTQQLASAASPAPRTPSLLADDPQWEDIDPAEIAQEDSLVAHIARTSSAPARKKPALGRYFAPTDQYNKAAVRSTKKRNKHQLGRPGVRVAGHDLWSVEGGRAQRYLIKSGSRTVLADVITDKMRIALNPAHSRLLVLPDGSRQRCVFVWAGGRGAAWMPLSSLKTKNRARVRKAVDARAKAWDPAAASAKHVTKFRFANGGNSGASARDRSSYILPGQKGKPNRVSDYLEHQVHTGLGRDRQYFNVSMNLPQGDAPAIATETARAGDVFFVPNNKQLFVRKIAVFGKGARTARSTQTWVYGFLAKEERGVLVPDRSRRGWVPIRVLEKA